jgi:hypothetical protein
LVAVVFHREAPRVLFRGVIGIGLNVVFLVGSIYLGSISKKQAEVRRQNMAEVDKAREEMNKNLREAVEGGTNSYKKAPERLKNYQEAIDKASRDMKGSEASIMKAGSAYMGRLQSEMVIFQKAVTPFVEGNMLQVDAIRDVNAIAQRRSITTNFIAANRRLRAFIAKSEEMFDAELVRNDVTGTRREKALDSFKVGANRGNPLVLKIREQDEVIGQTTLELLELLEASWGAWKYDSATEVITFEEAKNSAKYTELVERLNKASETETELQQKALALQEAANKERELAKRPPK